MKFTRILCCVLLLFCCVSCAKSNDNKGKEEIPKDNYNGKVYDLEHYMSPIWKSDTIYNETGMFVGKDDCLPLMFKAKKILAVRSFDLETDFKENVDYTFKDNKICLTPQTTMPYFEKDDYYLKTAKPGSSFECSKGGYIFFGEGSSMISKQIAVTYEKDEAWDGFIPDSKAEKLTRTIDKLKKKEDLNIVFYGDSITVGANASEFVGQEPYAPIWAKMVTNFIKKKYSSKVNYVNTAMGGMGTTWGLENIDKNVIKHNPDLVFLGFGMNDAGTTPASYHTMMNDMIKKIKTANPLCDIVLVSTMLPNAEVKGFYGNQIKFEPKLIQLENQNEHVATAPVTSMHESILTKKRYYDMTGNNVNHPNDFLTRIYAQTIIQTIFGE